MSIMREMLNASITHSGPPRDPVLAAWWGGGDNASGETVNADTAMRTAAVLGCVNVLAETLATLPCHLYRRTKDGGKERATDKSLYATLHRAPNRWQTAFEFQEMMTRHLYLRGNAYAKKQWGPRRKMDLIPLHPDRVTPFWGSDGMPAYHYQPLDGPAYVILFAEMHHRKMGSKDGLKGESLITTAQETIGISLAADKFGGRFFKNDATPSGLLTHPSHFKDLESFKRFKTEWQAAQSGGNQHRTAILEDGMKYESIGVTNKDSQFLELRQYQVADVCRIFRVPPHLVQDLSKATFSNIEEQGINFSVYTMTPLAVRTEQSMERDFLTDAEQADYFIEFLIDGLLRGNQASRYAAYAIGRQNGFLSANDVRKLENMNPVENGDMYLVPLNMVPADQAGKQPGNPVAAALARTAAMRAAHKEATAVNKARKRLQMAGTNGLVGQEFLAWATDFYAKQVIYVADALIISPEILEISAKKWAAEAVNGDIDAHNRVEELLGMCDISLIPESKPAPVASEPPHKLEFEALSREIAEIKDSLKNSAPPAPPAPITVNVAPPAVTVNVERPAPSAKTIKRDEKGNITEITDKEIE